MSLNLSIELGNLKKKYQVNLTINFVTLLNTNLKINYKMILFLNKFCVYYIFRQTDRQIERLQD